MDEYWKQLQLRLAAKKAGGGGGGFGEEKGVVLAFEGVGPGTRREELKALPVTLSDPSRKLPIGAQREDLKALASRWGEVRFRCPSAAPRLPLGCPSAALRLPFGCPSAALRLPLGCPSARVVVPLSFFACQVRFVDFNRGDSDGFVRFAAAGGAKAALEALAAGGEEVSGAMPQISRLISAKKRLTSADLG